MGEITKITPTVVFKFDELKRNGLVHAVTADDAVPGRTLTLVTTMCGIQAIGTVRLRRGFNCMECKEALRNAAEPILSNAESEKGMPLDS